MRLLLAEDEKELSNALCAILKHHNYSVDAVYNGKDALEYGLAENYDAILLDIMMPKMNGIDVLKALRNDDRRPNPKPNRPFSKHMSVETPFQTRYFIVRTNTQNEIIEIDTSHIAAITSTNAETYATNALKKNSKTGFADIYKYLIKETENGSVLVFVDCHSSFFGTKRKKHFTKNREYLRFNSGRGFESSL